MLPRASGCSAWGIRYELFDTTCPPPAGRRVLTRITRPFCTDCEKSGHITHFLSTTRQTAADRKPGLKLDGGCSISLLDRRPAEVEEVSGRQ